MDAPQVDIGALAALARIDIPESEKVALEEEIPAILGFVQTIQSTVTEKGKPVPGRHRNVMRDDVPAHESGQYTEDLLNAAPQREGDYLKVKQVITGGKHAAE